MALHQMTVIKFWISFLLLLVANVQESKQDFDEAGFTCANSNKVDMNVVCDSNNDCGDFSDELSCNCTDEQFRCNNSQCIELSTRCDHHTDCVDDSDETDCPACPSTSFTCTWGPCLNSSQVCDGNADCNDGLDEVNCTKCLGSAFHCQNRACVLASYRCDGEDDCGDNSDEIYCTVSCPSDRTFLCPNNTKCIEERFKCSKNHINGCPSGSADVENCPPPPCSEKQFKCLTGQCISSVKRCDGHGDCPENDDESNCTKCGPAGFHCDNNMCIPLLWRCDGKNDCSSDERGCHNI